jgi:hypothetical protein
VPFGAYAPLAGGNAVLSTRTCRRWCDGMTEPKKQHAGRARRRLPEVLKGPAHRDSRKSKTTLHPEGEDNRRQPSLPLVKWLSRKDVS